MRYACSLKVCNRWTAGRTTHSNEDNIIIGVRSFQVSGPTLWSYLPRQLRDSDLSLMTFKDHLKTELFRDAIAWKENTACRRFCDVVNIKERFEMSD